jgi:hypothetical protein
MNFASQQQDQALVVNQSPKLDGTVAQDSLEEKLNRPVQRLLVERSQLVLFQNLRLVQLFAGLQHAELIPLL